jgi:excisionase family DNA binding protein
MRPTDYDFFADWITVRDAMKILGVGRTKMQALKNEGEIRFTQDQKKLKFSLESIKKYLNDHST